MFANCRKLSSKLFTRQLTTQKSQYNFSAFVIPNRERANIFAENRLGVLSEVLAVFQKNQITCTDVSSKVLNVDKNGTQQVQFGIDFEGSLGDPRINSIIEELNKFSRVILNNDCPNVPWFPSSLKDLDETGNILQTPNEDAGNDHPGFRDPIYKARRDEIAKNAKGYEMGTPIPGMVYTSQENKTWEYIYSRLRPLQEKYMCDSFNKSFEKMVSAGIIKPNEIPQLQEINEFLIRETNFRLKPVTGILSQREFFNSLALRTFCCTQYIRHHSMPEYTPEPDIIHEIIGHVAMFADPDFCDLTQEFGLQSLGNTPENIEKLGALYWYTAEFGVCKEGNAIKGYGAGIGSSIGEIKNFGENKAEFRTLDPFRELNLNFPIQTLQPIYYVADSFKDAIDTLIKYGGCLPRPFKTYFNYMKHTVEVDKKITLTKIEEKPVEF